MSQTEWSDLGVSGLPTGTVTLKRGPIDAATEVVQHFRMVGEDGVISGLGNLAAMLAEHIETTTGVSTFETLRNTSEAD